MQQLKKAYMAETLCLFDIYYANCSLIPTFQQCVVNEPPPYYSTYIGRHECTGGIGTGQQPTCECSQRVSHSTNSKGDTFTYTGDPNITLYINLPLPPILIQAVYC